MFTFPRRCEGPESGRGRGRDRDGNPRQRPRSRETQECEETRKLEEAGERQQDRLKYRKTDSEQAQRGATWGGLNMIRLAILLKMQ